MKDGLILALVCVIVVFSSLIILAVFYTFSGKLFSRKAAKAAAPKAAKKAKPAAAASPEGETAAAIAVALERHFSSSDEVQVAIATALHLYLAGNAHDREPYVLTMNSTETSAWRNKSLNFRKTPIR